MRVILVYLLVFVGINVWGQILIPNTTPVTENFDGMGTTLATPSANWKIHQSATPTWAGGTTVLDFQFSTGAPASGGKYNWGTSATERALGVMTSGSYASPNSVISFYQNTNAGNLTQLSVSYDLERYRRNTAAASVQFFYSLDGTTWTSVSAGDIAAATLVTGASLYGYTQAVFPVASFNITGLNIATNANIYLRWNLNTTGGSSQGIGIDNVSVTGAFTTPCSAPTATLSSTSSTLCANTITSFSVGTNASGVPTYTWEASANGSTGWATVIDATPANTTYTAINSNSLSLTTGTTSLVYYYRVKVTEGGTCTAISNTYTLTTVATPTVSAPASRTVCSTATTSFVVTSSGTTLQWQYSNDAGVTFTNVTVDATHTSVTTNTLPLVAPSATLNGYVYRAVVSNAYCNSVNSATAMLTAIAIPAMPPALMPSSNPACSSLTFAAMTSTVLGVTWYWQTTPAGVLTASNTSSPYVNSLIGNNDFFVRAISDIGNCPSAASSITVDVNSPVTITTQPTNKSICSGANTSFSIGGITGSVPRQWQYSNDGGVTFTNTPVDAVHSTGTVSTINLTSVPISLTNYVYRIVVNQPGCGSVISNTALLTVNSIPADPPAPTALVNPACNSTSLAAMSSTVGGVTWYWEGTSATATLTTNQTNVNSPTINSSGTYYVRAVAGVCASAASSSVVVTILTSPAVATQPASYTVATIGTAVFTSGITGGNMSYQWYENAGSGFVAVANGSTNPTYAGATTSVLTVANPPVAMSGYSYQCIATNACGTTTTNGAAKMSVGTGTNNCAVGGAMSPPFLNGCGVSPTGCNLASVYSSYGTFCNTSAVICGAGCSTASLSTVYNLSAGCTANITAEFKARSIPTSSCSNAAMDAGDKLYITSSGGTINSQSANLTGCSAFSSTTTATIPSGCGNGDGTVTMNVTGGQVIIGGESDRGDEIITYSVTLTGACANNCPVILPISLVDFYATQNGDKNDVIWKVAMEENIMSYLIEKSSDGIEFLPMSNQLPTPPSYDLKKYLLEDLNPNNGITYYRLSTLETDWSIKYYPIVSLDRNSKDVKPIFIENETNLSVEFKNTVPKNSTISIIDVTGKEILTKKITDSFINFSKEIFATGLYFVRITTPYKTENFKVIITK